jgi:hypothetical protein
MEEGNTEVIDLRSFKTNFKRREALKVRYLQWISATGIIIVNHNFILFSSYVCIWMRNKVNVVIYAFYRCTTVVKWLYWINCSQGCKSRSQEFSSSVR